MTDVNEPRNTNAPLSITVLCACLGLLITGAPAQVHARQAWAAAEGQHYVASSTRLRLAASAVSPLQVLKIDLPWLPDFAARAKALPETVLYQNSKALTDPTRVLLITHLPRAALSDLPGEIAAGFLSRDEE